MSLRAKKTHPTAASLTLLACPTNIRPTVRPLPAYSRGRTHDVASPLSRLESRSSLGTACAKPPREERVLARFHDRRFVMAVKRPTLAQLHEVSRDLGMTLGDEAAARDRGLERMAASLYEVLG